MQYFYWNEKFETGVEAIDHQHRTLVDLINKLSVAISHQGSLPESEKILITLIDYTNNHFRDEESIMAASDLPEDEKNKHLQEHCSMATEISRRAKQCDLSKEAFADEILPFLNSWLIKHILGSDMKMVNALKSQRGEPSPEPSPFNITNVEQVLLNALNESERRFRFFTDSAPVMVWISDTRQNRTFFNKSWSEFAGEAIDLYQDQWCELIHPDDREHYLLFLANLTATTSSTECEYRILRNDGEYRYLLERVMPRFENDNTFIGYISSATDISIQKQSEQTLSQINEKLEGEVRQRTQEIEALLRTDHLTQVGNRRFIMERLDEELKRCDRYGNSLSLLFVDIDYFKNINDTYGHDIGDQVLRKIASELQEEARDIDALGRFGGEEFLVILPETSLQGATFIAERMRARIKATKFEGMDKSLSISISVGVAERSADEAAEDLIKRADEALYQAKSEGRNRVQMAA